MDATYSSQYQELWRNHWWWKTRHNVVLDTVSTLFRDDKPGAAPRTLLDIGCCGGVAFDDLSRFGEVYGLEPDPLLVDNVPRWRPRIEQVPFGGAYKSPRMYDLVLMLDVLEHIEDDANALARVWDMLRPGGYLLLTVPALRSLWSVHDEVNHHFRRYTAHDLRDVLEDQYFEVPKLRYMFFWSLGLVYLRKWLATRKKAEYQVTVPPAYMNKPFQWMTQIEEWLGKRLRLSPPLGSSLLAVARKPVELPVGREPEEPSRSKQRQRSGAGHTKNMIRR